MYQEKKTNKCLDCNKSIYKRNKRCASCNYKNPVRNKKISNNNLGSNNPNWKGGRVTSSDGYIKVKIKNHYLSDANGYVSEHRLVASQKYKRKLTKTDIIHHLNGIRDDNRPENLVITNKKGNGEKTYIKQLNLRIQELESKLSNYEL